jgi:hypothetical protein
MLTTGFISENSEHRKIQKTRFISEKNSEHRKIQKTRFLTPVLDFVLSLVHSAESEILIGYRLPVTCQQVTQLTYIFWRISVKFGVGNN